MPLRAVVYQAEFFNHGRKDHHHTLHSFYDDSQSSYDPFHFLTSQAHTCNCANSICWPPSVVPPENETENLLPSSGYVQKKRQACHRRRHSRGEICEEAMRHQRLTHIEVERNRRKQVNEYLSAIRSLMPDSYADKGDQASIIGGAIKFVKELEQKLQWLESHKHNKNSSPSVPFSNFLTSPNSESSTCLRSRAADVEVSMAECFVNLKIRVITGAVKKPLLPRILQYLDEYKLTVLHLNACGVDRVVLYTICMKVEDECKLTSEDEIAIAMHQVLSTIQREAMG
uniref:BHLH domain-containing protein n=1 Tax=Kalanchoe fedtschenkoi TaxID=63787 RepID=A0A7N0TGA9_KALFE